jgi:hypothetical protein
MNCSGCGFTIKNTDKFCNKCGEDCTKKKPVEIPVHISQNVFCEKCKSSNKLDARFCQECGQQLMQTDSDVIHKELNKVSQIDAAVPEESKNESNQTSDKAKSQTGTILFVLLLMGGFFLWIISDGKGNKYMNSNSGFKHSSESIRITSSHVQFNGISLGDSEFQFRKVESEREKFDEEEYGHTKTNKGLYVMSDRGNPRKINQIFLDCAYQKGLEDASIDGVGCKSTLYDIKNKLVGYKAFCENTGRYIYLVKGNGFVGFAPIQGEVGDFGLVKNYKDLIADSPYNEGYKQCKLPI